ncbi:MAG: hypothetical protein HN353_00165 [Bdellovibrionales bacterium]|jgi:hypothetical protein|nr:hypothetical protein [Bdellovibrionales bacterium]MBT3526675.1 hypothetical protein [Bdellovibrionales bacterium]MBT7669954.1 hypothetical protein [Bdellovibrionales bacterium]MBT7765895.1 hypothetical protein [Bdellovibrionales bacterium]
MHKNRSITLLFILGISGLTALWLFRGVQDSSSNQQLQTRSPSLSPSSRQNFIFPINKKIIVNSPTKFSNYIEHCLANGQHSTNLSDNPTSILGQITPQLSMIGKKRQLWSNVHFIGDDGQIYRLRHLVDDGQNGEFRKLILYVEDQDGFPLVHPLPTNISSINPTPEQIEQLLAGHRIIHQEVADNYQNGDLDLFVETINGKITRFELNSKKTTFRCES